MPSPPPSAEACPPVPGLPARLARRALARAPRRRGAALRARVHTRRDRGDPRAAARHGELAPAPGPGRPGGRDRAGGSTMRELERALRDAPLPDEAAAAARA